MKGHAVTKRVPRLPDWPERLAALVADRLAKPFTWGSNDCVVFSADCVAAITGADPLKGIRGSWKTAPAAARIVARRRGIEKAVGGVLGKPIAPLTAAMGDVGLVLWEGVETLGVCRGPDWLVVAGEGLAVLPFEAARVAWRV